MTQSEFLTAASDICDALSVALGAVATFASGGQVQSTPPPEGEPSTIPEPLVQLQALIADADKQSKAIAALVDEGIS